jgi:hypothetical protein
MKTILIACALLVVPARAADREFSDVVRVISDEFHTNPVRIPFFGLVNVFTAVVKPAGTRHIDLAVFEHLNNRDGTGRNVTEGIKAAVGVSWKPFIQVRSYRHGREETVSVYMRQQGREWKLLVAAVERDQATVVQLLLDADALARWVSDPERCARHWHDQGD